MRRQSKPTLLCAQIVDASISGHPARPALLEEISPEGAIISMDCPARSGANINLDCSTCELRGKVVGCRNVGGGYIAEVAFAAGEPWSPGRFFPEQGFNPEYLVCKNPFCTPECTDECAPRADGLHAPRGRGGAG